LGIYGEPREVRLQDRDLFRTPGRLERGVHSRLLRGRLVRKRERPGVQRSGGVPGGGAAFDGNYERAHAVPDVWFTRPAGVRTRSVCSVSGEPVGPFCPASVPDVYIPGHSDESLCGLHVEAVVDKKGFETCRECRTGPRSAYRRKVVTLWPPEVAAFLRSQGKALAPLPPHNPACPALGREGGLRIESPRAGGSYQVTEALRRGRQKLPLRAASQRGDGPVYWYLDGALLGRAGPDETLFVDPWPGSHRVAVADSRGRLDQVEFVVRP
jgi:penicillin-binding protein 1C